MENFPVAFILASCDQVYTNNNVLFRLVRPAKDGAGVESMDRLVNVVPFRRKYQFRALCDIDNFIHEILTRPLVLQPVMHFGRGIGGCGVCYSEEPWIVMINQTHPKILSRLQMGMDAARAAFIRGNSAEIKFCFTKAIQRLYCEHLQKREQKDAQGSVLRTMLTNCRFAEWEHADLIIRFHGYYPNASKIIYSNQTVDLEWSFEDIDSEEMIWSQVGDQIFPHPHLASISEDEIRQVLPSWTINKISPLQDVGVEVPHMNYSYSKAGTLYESFRKKKRQRGQPPPMPHLSQPATLSASALLDEGSRGGTGIDEEEDYDFGYGAIGRAIEFDHHHYHPHQHHHEEFEGIEHDFTRGNNDKPNSSRSSSRRAYMYGADNREDYYAGDDRRDMRPHSYNDHHYKSHLSSQNRYDDDDVNAIHSYESSRHGADSQRYEGRHDLRDTYNNHPSHQYPNRYHPDNHVSDSSPISAEINNAHVDAEVCIVNPSLPSSSVPSSSKSVPRYDKHAHKSNRALSPSNNYANSFGIRKQDSDRSTGSTNADSGYCEDGRRSRGDSYDYNDNSGGNFKYARHLDEKVSSAFNKHPGGMDNPAFSDFDELDDNVNTTNALAIHKKTTADATMNSFSRPPTSKLSSSAAAASQFGGNVATHGSTEKISESII